MEVKMPIKGLSDQKRLPRLGKIHLGVKAKNAEGKEYPKAVDYFVCPPEVQAVFSEKPKLLRIMFPVENPDEFASQFYKMYSAGRGLMCKGDGVKANRLCDSGTGKLAGRDSVNTEIAEVECTGRECEYYGKYCSEVMSLQFLLPEVPGLGVWQIDTGSINSIRNVNSAVELIRNVAGHVAGIPLSLTLEPQDITADGRKKTVHVLNVRIGARLTDLVGVQRFQIEAPKEIQGASVHVEPHAEYVAEVKEDEPKPEVKETRRGRKPKSETTPATPTTPNQVETVKSEPAAPEPVLPDPDDEPPDLIMPQNQEPKQGEKLTSVGGLLTACYKKWGIMRADTLKLIGVSDVMEITDLNEAYQKVEQAMKGKGK
jgi:hypothetical protein